MPKPRAKSTPKTKSPDLGRGKPAAKKAPAKKARPKSAKADPKAEAPLSTVDRNALLKVHYEAGVRQLNDIAAQFGVTPGRVCQLAVQFGWKKGDLTEKIRERAAGKVAAAEKAIDAKAADVQEAVIDANAQVQANIIIRERQDARADLELVTSLAQELREANELARLPAIKRPDGSPIPLPLADRIDGARKVIVMRRNAVDLERVVYNIAQDTPVDPAQRTKEVLDNGIEGLREQFAKRLAARAAA